ncbi:MAG: hypothetical protein M5U28_44350 [Sandaracinaceae bacterium]|nr:hypothetical protein [Sandaracinaceae bacterium]
MLADQRLVVRGRHLASGALPVPRAQALHEGVVHDDPARIGGRPSRRQHPVHAEDGEPDQRNATSGSRRARASQGTD